MIPATFGDSPPFHLAPLWVKHFVLIKDFLSKAIPGIAMKFSIVIHGAPRMNPDDFCQLHLSREISKHLTDWQTMRKDINGFQMLSSSVPTLQG